MTQANAPHPLADLVTKIGKITLAWNDLHFFIFAIFWRLNSNHALRSSAIFFSVQADRTQRNMTAALIKLELEQVPLLRDAAIAILNEIGKTAGRRNDLVHAMWDFESDWERGTATVFEPSSPRLSKKRLNEELDKLYADLIAIGARLRTIKKQIDEFWKIRERFQKQPSVHPEQPNAEMANPPADSPLDNPQDE
jgi:hypothetical protein